MCIPCTSFSRPIRHWGALWKGSVGTGNGKYANQSQIALLITLMNCCTQCSFVKWYKMWIASGVRRGVIRQIIVGNLFKTPNAMHCIFSLCWPRFTNKYCNKRPDLVAWNEIRWICLKIMILTQTDNVWSGVSDHSWTCDARTLLVTTLRPSARARKVIKKIISRQLCIHLK